MIFKNISEDLSVFCFITFGAFF